MLRFILLSCFFSACSPQLRPAWPERHSSLAGSEFYRQAAAMSWKQRDSFALKELMAGNMPGFIKKFVPVTIHSKDTVTGRSLTAVLYVAPDYLSIGTNEDWARIPLTPMAAQQVADSSQCFLPTKKIVDEIYRQAKVKPEPVPMYAFRDTTVTMWQHHLIIEGQRKGKKGLIAGIKKDVVISGKVIRDSRNNRVAIYGWHQLNRNPIQPLYTGHVNWYVDYSHGIRLVYRKIKVNGTWMDHQAILNDPVLKQLLCDEPSCDHYRYLY